MQRDITLTLRDLWIPNYGALLQASVTLDIQSISQPRPGHSRRELQLTALDRALDNAAAKAARMAKQARRRIGAG